MRNAIAFAALALGVSPVVAGSTGAQEKAAEAQGATRLMHKLKKGWSQEFTVARSSTTKSETSQGSFEGKDEGKTVYRVEVAEVKDSGALALDVTIVSVQLAMSGRGDGVEFDSTKPAAAGESEAMGALRTALKSTARVTVEGGKVKEVSGLPELPRPQRGAGGNDGNTPRGQFRGLRLLGTVSPFSVRRDLGMILASQLQGQDLVKGKEYHPQPIERPAGDQQQGDTPRRGQGPGRGGPGGVGGDRLSFLFEGESEGAAAFQVKLAPPPQGGANNQRAGTVERTGEGKARVSLEDGLLQSLEATTHTLRKGERNGNTFSFATTTRTSISRGAANTPVKKVEL